MFTLIYGAIVDLLESFGSILESAFFERLLHGQIRPGFALGMGIMFISGTMMVIWCMLYPDVHSYISMSGIAFCLGIGLIGSLIQTNTDIEDQEAGRYSNMGSGWNLWEDNIVFNKIGQFILVVLIIFSFGASIYFFTENAHQEAVVKLTRVVSKSPVKTPTHPTAHKPHPATVIHHHGEKTTHAK